MKDQEGNQPESATDRVLTVAEVIDSEKKLDSTATPEIALGEKAETQSKSYQRSRNVALLKLALIRGEDSEAVSKLRIGACSVKIEYELGRNLRPPEQRRGRAVRRPQQPSISSHRPFVWQFI